MERSDFMLVTMKVFYHNVLTQIQTTGSIAPSSRFLARAITQCVEKKPEPVSILEVGPGTGPFTRVLAQKLGEGDHLDLCELNGGFVNYLRQRLQRDPVLYAHREQISIYHQSIIEFGGENQYDYIVSGLPFNNFPPYLVQEILERYRILLKPGGLLSFFEYAMIRQIKGPFIWGNERLRIRSIDHIFKHYLRPYEIDRIFVTLNLPPAIVHVCRYK
jgi:phospholipid N-methyltransferase